MKNDKGFKLSVENLLVVIAILMILTATFAPRFAKSRAEANPGKGVHQAQTSTRASVR
jgi:type II secretory pathway pseudopilin PulG